MKRVIKIFKFTLVLLLVFGWVFNYPPINFGGRGWPNFGEFRIWNLEFGVPPKIKQARAAVSFVGSAVASNSPNTEGPVVSLTGITGLTAGDLIIVAGAVGDTANNGLAAPKTGGYTRIGSATIYSNDSNDVNLDLYYKFHNGTDTEVRFDDVGGTNASNAAVVMVFRGVALAADGGPFDTAVSTASGIDTSNANPPSHDWSGASGVWTVIVGATGHTGTATATYTAPTGYTTNFAYRAHDDTIDALVGMGYNTNPSDPEDPVAFTAANIGTAANNAWAAATMSLKPAPSITTLSTGTNPGSSTIAPGGSITSVNGFTLTTNTGTDAITAITVNLSTNNGVGTLTITDAADTVLGSIGGGIGTGIVTGSNSISITNTNATTGGTAFKVKVTPLSHTDMPAPAGGEYAITGVVTDWTGSNTKAGQATDTSDTVTIDNLSPAGTTDANATPGNGQVDVSWTNPGDGFQKVIIYCKTASISETPTEGSDPSVDGSPCDGTARVKYSGTASPQTITSLTNNTLYYFRIFARDTNGNFTAIVSTQEVSATPIAPSLSITAPANVAMPNYTLGGVGYSERNFQDVAASVQVTSSSNFSVTVISTNGLSGANNTITTANVRLRTDGTAASNPTYITCSGTTTINERASDIYALDTSQEILNTTSTSGSVTCDIYPTIRVYINNYNVYAEEDSGTLTFTVVAT